MGEWNRLRHLSNLTKILAISEIANLKFSISHQTPDREWTEAKEVIATSSKGLIDTGAEIDYISKAFFNKINKSSDYKVENTDMILKKVHSETHQCTDQKVKILILTYNYIIS